MMVAVSREEIMATCDTPHHSRLYNGAWCEKRGEHMTSMCRLMCFKTHPPTLFVMVIKHNCKCALSLLALNGNNKEDKMCCNWLEINKIFISLIEISP